MMNDIIEATILNVKFIGEDGLLPRIPMIPADMFKRLQYPVQLAFAMTINIAHGQLYLACSRIGKPSDLFVYTPERKTKNIVYSKAFQ
jgi:ATP-dependent DNA helicase PIF1